MIRLWLVAALALPWAAGAWADEWGEVAVVSATLGVQDNRLCLGEGSRGAIGCPSYAPYVEPVTGYVGINTASPGVDLVISSSIPAIQLLSTSGTRSAYIRGNAGNLYLDNNGTAWNTYFRAGSTSVAVIKGTGAFGLGTDNPSTTLHVSGTVRIGNAGESCDANRAGAIRYAGSQFQVCYGSGGWSNLADTSSTVATADRITSGTVAVIANGGSNSISITESGVTTGYYYNGIWVAGGVSTTGGISSTNGYFTNRVGIGTAPLSSTLSLRRLSYNTTVGQLDNSLRLTNPTTTPNAGSEILFAGHGGTDAQNIFAAISAKVDTNSSGAAGYLAFSTKENNSYNIENAERMRLTRTGRLGISTTTPQTLLDVSGTIRIANGGETCDTDRAGAIRYVSNNFQVCYGTGGWANLADASSTVATADRIVSGTAQVIANGNSNSISITESGVTTGYYYNGIWVAGGVSTTGTISATDAYITNNINAGGVVRAASGTSVLPSFSFTNDYNTGFYSPATDNLAIIANGNTSLLAGTSGNTLYGMTRFGGSDTSLYRQAINHLRTGGNLSVDGLVSIGTTAPLATLHVAGNVLATSWTYLNANPAVRVTPTAPLEVSGTVSATTFVGRFTGDGSGLTGLSSGDRITSGTAAVIANGNSNSISITESGVTTGYYYNGIWVAGGVSTTGGISGSTGYFTNNVGIGTDSPTAKLDIYGVPTHTENVTSTPGSMIVRGSNVTPALTTKGILDIEQSGSVAAQGAGATLTFSNNNWQFGTSYSRVGGAIKVGLDSSVNQDPTSHMAFSTTGYGSTLTERLRITSGGNVGIGRTTPTAPLEVSGTVSATVLQLADNPAATCGPGTYGTVKIINGRQYTCRP